MSKQIFTGQQQWEGYHVLCRPLELCGIDRRLFALLAINFAIWWQGFGSFLIGIGLSYGIYYFFRVVSKVDPQFFFVLKGAARYQAAWYDHGYPPTEYGPLIVPDSEYVADLERVSRRRRRSAYGLSRRIAGLRDLVSSRSD